MCICWFSLPLDMMGEIISYFSCLNILNPGILIFIKHNLSIIVLLEPNFEQNSLFGGNSLQQNSLFSSRMCKGLLVFDSTYTTEHLPVTYLA